ncbi:MAG: hypothetical protein U5J63_04005 [Fodinibius sp.]|nr:hypothetical protein [Fodinibius sp.]
MNTPSERARSRQLRPDRPIALSLPEGRLLTQLRGATREQHARLEALPVLQRLFAGIIPWLNITLLLQSFSPSFTHWKPR